MRFLRFPEHYGKSSRRRLLSREFQKKNIPVIEIKKIWFQSYGARRITPAARLWLCCRPADATRIPGKSWRYNR